MTRKKKILFALIGLSLAGFTAACAHHYHAHGGHGERARAFLSARVDDALDEVDASDKQRSKVHSIKTHLFNEFESAHAGHAQTRIKMMGVWKSDAPDAKRLHKLADARVDAYRAALHEMVDGLVEVHGVLEKEQRMRLASLIEEKIERHHHN